MSYQAIETTYFGHTNRRSARVQAKAAAGTIYRSWDDSLGIEANHRLAAKELAEKFGWRGRWYVGSKPDGKGNVYVSGELHEFDT